MISEINLSRERALFRSSSVAPAMVFPDLQATSRNNGRILPSGLFIAQSPFCSNDIVISVKKNTLIRIPSIICPEMKTLCRKKNHCPLR